MMTRAPALMLTAACGCSTSGPPVEKQPPLPPECQVYPASQVERPSATERDFRGADAAFRSGLEKLDADRYEAALSRFEEALLLDPTYGLAYLAQADSLKGLGETEARKMPLMKAILLLPDNPRAHAELGLVLSDLGESEPAMVHLACALSRRKDLHDARMRLVLEQMDAGDYADAESNLRTLMDAQGPSVRTLAMLGRVLEAQGRFAESAQAVLQAAGMARENAVLLRRAAVLYDRADQPEKADAVRERADAVDPPPPSRDMRPLPPARRR